ncbi:MULTISPECIES: O-antigen ligase family protein [Protofrankia]|uniref:O-antigen polymerase n=2 Tax=Candidatus Protofrankia datiscae TaxID=2716812 RepID=F8B0G8_9ACTN|nr:MULTISPECIES: O-antigen ligase family protein [Protofrankia]AEH09717.1 O-antigen polymerase [Candidatus Protofrankia datiscae]
MRTAAARAARPRPPGASRLGAAGPALPDPGRAAPGRPETVVAVAAAVGAALVGAALAERVWMGLALLVFVLYVALTTVNLRLAIALWTPTLFLEAVPAFNLAAKAAGLVIILRWLTAPRGPTPTQWTAGSPAGQPAEPERPVGRGAWWGAWWTTGRAGVDFSALRQRPGLVTVGMLLLTWLSLSLLWAVDIGAAATDLWHWWALVMIFVVVSTAMADMRAVRMAAGAFLAGAVLSVAVGLAGAGPWPSNPAGLAGAPRLQGGAGDPNFLASWLVAGLILAVGLIAASESRALRRLLLAASGLAAVGLAATLSRGAFVAAGASAFAALVLLRRHRRRVAGLILLVTAAATAWLATSPAAWERITTNDRGDGRVDLWKVAWSVVRDHPVLGVGLNNYTAVESDYVRRVGPVPWLDIIISRAHEVHNAYLQLLAENGIVGVVLFLAFLILCLRSMFLATRRFDALGDRRNATVASAVLLATFSMAVSGVFLSNAIDKRLWFLLALGPALLRAATDSPRPPVEHASPPGVFLSPAACAVEERHPAGKEDRRPADKPGVRDGISRPDPGRGSWHGRR